MAEILFVQQRRVTFPVETEPADETPKDRTETLREDHFDKYVATVGFSRIPRKRHAGSLVGSRNQKLQPHEAKREHSNL